MHECIMFDIYIYNPKKKFVILVVWFYDMLWENELGAFSDWNQNETRMGLEFQWNPPRPEFLDFSDWNQNETRMKPDSGGMSPDFLEGNGYSTRFWWNSGGIPPDSIRLSSFRPESAGEGKVLPKPQVMKLRREMRLVM